MKFLTASLAHHWQVACLAWIHEKEARKHAKDKVKTRFGHETEFLPAALEITIAPPSPTGRLLIAALVAFFTITLLWAIFAELDIVASAPGTIIPNEKTRDIQALETAMVRQIMVEEGDPVIAGDVVALLDPVGIEADKQKYRQDLQTRQIEAMRLEAQLSATPQNMFKPPADAPPLVVEMQRQALASELSSLASRLAETASEITRAEAETRSTNAEIERLQAMLPRLKERVEGRRTLLERGFATRHSFLELEQQMVDLDGQLNVQINHLAEAKASLAKAKFRREQITADFRKQSLERLTDLRQQIAVLEQESAKAEQRGQAQALTSPVDGVVQQIARQTGVLREGEKLMSVVPINSWLEVEAKILNKDIGFIKHGQEAIVKIDSFPFTKYGTISGKVSQIGYDAVKDEALGLIYPVRVKLDRESIITDSATRKLTPLSAGMTVIAEIKTGSRTPLDYVLQPLQEYSGNSLRER